MSGIDHVGDVLVGARRLLGDAARRRAADENSAGREFIDHLTPLPLPDGRVAIVEFKTTRDEISPGSDYWKRLNIDRQVSVYMLGARALGYDATAVLYDAARVPGLRPRLLSRKSEERESPEQFGQFIRREFDKWREVVKLSGLKLE